MEKIRNKKRKWTWVLLIIVIIILVLVFLNRHWIHMAIQNVTGEKVELDTAEWTKGTSYEKLQYSDVSESDYMNLYVPEMDEPMPLFILVHGGGFVLNDCESRQAQFMYRYFRDQGYACASINYRLAGEAKFPGAVEDVKASIRFLRANAEKYGFDGNRIAIWGESAGGYIATMAAVSSEDEFNGVSFIGEEKLSEPVSAKVDVLVDYYGCMDLASIQEDFENEGVPNFVFNIANSALSKEIGDFKHAEDYWVGKNLSDCSQEEIEELTPSSYIKKNLKPDDLKVYIYHGDADMSVPITQSERIASVYREVLGEENVEFIRMKGIGHGADAMYKDEVLSGLCDSLNETFYK